MKPIRSPKHRLLPLRKCPTGIRGLDDVTGGGLPAGRPTLVCGGPGCGKTLLAMEFLVHGAIEFREPGVFLAFEESIEDMTKNVASLGFDLRRLVTDGKLALDYVRIERSEIEESGAYDLEGLFIRLGHAIDSIGAKRVVLDTIEALFSALPNHAVLRAELRRLFNWLRARGVTAVITGERGDGALTRFGIEEYVSDCVIVLDHRVTNELCTRRLRLVKYRGSAHGTNEYPFLIDTRGITVLPVTSLGLAHGASGDRIPTGIRRLDTMLGGKGVYRGSSVLVSGPAGCGKTSMAAHFVDAACRRGERCLYFLLEESPGQFMRNMRSIGLRLEPWLRRGLLCCHAARPSYYGLETHLATMLTAIREFQPHVVVIDPISSFIGNGGNTAEVHSMLLRLIDALKVANVTTLVTDLTHADAPEQTMSQISSLIDTWLLLRDIEANGERNRGLYVLKSRGMAHSRQIRELVMTDHGLDLTDVYVGAGGVLTGSARAAQEARELAERGDAAEEIGRQEVAWRRKREDFQRRIAALRAEFSDAEAAAQGLIRQERRRAEILAGDRAAMFSRRGGDASDRRAFRLRAQPQAAASKP
jgi:circadian clock protein KaiC